jgi:hypothetical protein|tara:strand:+ start:605 stop:835 length:231 start_codon:yes stop_codon:yes gene_type:complete
MKIQEFKKAMKEVFGDRYIDGDLEGSLNLRSKKDDSIDLRESAHKLLFQGNAKQKLEGAGMLKVLDKLNLDNGKTK